VSGLRIGGLLIAILAAGIFVAPAAQAVLLEVDLNTPGDALVTRDTATGLDWLDLTESTNLSFDQVEADVGGFISDGWRHATGAEVCALFAAVDAEPSPCPGNLVVALSAGPLHFLLGRTFTGENEFSARGFYDDGDPSAPGGVGFAEVTILVGAPRTAAHDDQRASDLASPSEGNFLVRASPVAMPIGPYSRAALLILVALTGLVMVRRRSSAG
jgi:hypothetical protein